MTESGAWECRARREPCLAALLSVEARNLWTQELHANSVQALIARPEIRNTRQFVPIGIDV